MQGPRRLNHAELVVAIVFTMAAVCLLAAPQGDPEPPIACQPNGQENVSPADAVQACIDRAPAFSAVEIPVGNYLLNHQIVVSKPLTLRTLGPAGASSC